jgi:hypothetical protein
MEVSSTTQASSKKAGRNKRGRGKEHPASSHETNINRYLDDLATSVEDEVGYQRAGANLKIQDVIKDLIQGSHNQYITT